MISCFIKFSSLALITGQMFRDVSLCTYLFRSVRKFPPLKSLGVSLKEQTYFFSEGFKISSLRLPLIFNVNDNLLQPCNKIIKVLNDVFSIFTNGYSKCNVEGK